MSEEEVETGVFVLGANTVRYGHSTAEVPSYTSAPLVVCNGSGSKTLYKGAQKLVHPCVDSGVDSCLEQQPFDGSAEEETGGITLKRFIVGGIVTDWTALEMLLKDAMESVSSKPPDILLFGECPMAPKHMRERLLQFAFESTEVYGVYVASNATLSLYAAGATTGLAVDCGHDGCVVVPVYEGYGMSYAARRCPVGGRQVEWGLARAIREEVGSDQPILLSDTERLKVYHGIVVHEYEEALANAAAGESNCLFHLSDGRSFMLGTERFTTTEALFDPAMLKIEGIGLVDAVVQSIKAADFELRKDLWGSIWLMGGTAELPGMEERLQLELVKRECTAAKVKVKTVPNPHLAAWVGGAIFSSLETFQWSCICKADYDSNGPAIVDRKCGW